MSSRIDIALDRPRPGVVPAVVVGLTLLAAVIRMVGLNGALWYDEIVTLVIAVRPPLSDILTEFPTNNNHPLYSVLAHASVWAFGESPWTVRLPAYLFGVASVPLLYWLGTLVTSRLESMLSALVLTVSYHHVWFSQNARGYTALAFWTIAATICLLQGLRGHRRAWFGAYALCGALGIYTHLTMGFVVAAHGLVVAWDMRPWKAMPRARVSWLTITATFGATAGLALLLYLPLLREVTQFFSAAPAPGVEVATRGWAIREAIRGLQVGLGLLGLVGAGILAAVGFLSYLRQDRMFCALIATPAFLTVLGTVVMSRPIFPRFFFFLIGFGVMLIVRGAMGLARTAFRAQGEGAETSNRSVNVGVAIVGGVVVVSAAALARGSQLPKQDFGGALRYVEAVREPGEPIAVTGPAAFPYLAYYRRAWPEVTTPGELETARGDASRVWLIYTFPAYVRAVTPELMDTIERTCEPVEVFPGSVGAGDIVVCRIDQPGEAQPRP